jgi:hypothetical protein
VVGKIGINIHFQQALLLRFDTFKHGGIREFEHVILSGLEGIVGLGLRHLLDKGIKVPLVSPELEAVQVEDVSDRVVEEARVVGHDD